MFNLQYFRLIIILLLISGCSSMHFVNGPELEDVVVREQWHHNALNGLVEVSAPVDISYVCDDKQWDTITVEQSFLNGVASLASPAPPFLSLYSPWSVYYECRENID